MSKRTICLVDEFSDRPFGRYRDDGGRSAEVFREDHLMPALKGHDSVVVDLSNYNYYGSSFLEEVFGGLIRQGFTYGQLKDQLKVVHNQLPSIVEEAIAYMKGDAL